MKKVYTASNPTDAHLFKGILEANGIKCEIRGEELFSIRGEVPFTPDTLPSVWIKNNIDYLKAKQLAGDYISSEKIDPGENWTCRNCGESVEGQFGECWNCSTERPES